MRTVRILCVGRIKHAFWADGAAHYQKLLSRLARVELEEIKDAPGKWPDDKRRTHEAEAILARVRPGQHLVALDERGKTPGSRAFSAMLIDWMDDPAGPPVFVIGGPLGLHDDVRRAARTTLSLSAMTWPHELARVLLLEQCYRALAIAANLPYHND